MASALDPDLPPPFPLPNSAQRAPSNSKSTAAAAAIPSHAYPSMSFTVSGPSSTSSPAAATTTSNSSSSTSPISTSHRSEQPSDLTSSPHTYGQSAKVQALRSVLDLPPTSARFSSNGAMSSSISSATLVSRPSASPPPSSSSSSSTSSSSSSASLMPPPSTSRLTAPLGVGGASGACLSPSSPSSSASSQTLIPGETSGRKKVILKPGRSPLDWARLKSSNDSTLLRQGRLPFGVHGVERIPMSEVKKHVTRESCWSVFNGMVYNLTPYLEFHPGGEKEVLRVAGRDGTRLFMLTHSWVNIDAMIDACCIGIVAKDE